MKANLEKTNQAENLKHELAQLTKAANDAYLAVFAATYFAPESPEMLRLKQVIDGLRVAIVHAKNELKSNPPEQSGNWDWRLD